MSRHGKTQKNQKPAENNGSGNRILILVAIIGLLGTIVAAIINSFSVSKPVELTIQATQTAEARNHPPLGTSTTVNNTVHMHTKIAKSYIPTEAELPKGFSVKADQATSDLPITGCEGDRYEVFYVNDDCCSSDGGLLLFKVAVCNNEDGAKEAYSTTFDMQWPRLFIGMMGEPNNTSVSMRMNPTEEPFNLANVDEKRIFRYHVLDPSKNDSVSGAMDIITLRSKNVVAVTTVFVRGVESALNQVVYYASMIIEKIQDE